MSIQLCAPAPSSSNNSLFLLGGSTGVLGAEVAEGLVTSRGFDKRVALQGLVPSVSANPNKIEALRALGGTVESADFEDIYALTLSLQGAKVDVSVFDGIDVEYTEINVVDAAKMLTLRSNSVWGRLSPPFQGRSASDIHHQTNSSRTQQAD
jgi:hypothetical protein